MGVLGSFPISGLGMSNLNDTISPSRITLMLKVRRCIMRPFLCFLGCLLWACFFCACTDDSQLQRDHLNGRWVLVSAARDDRPTETLEGVYFQFSPDDTMQTNLPIGPETPMPFQVSKGTLTQQYPSQTIEYNIRSLNDSSLTLAMEMRGMLFVLNLKKQVQ